MRILLTGASGFLGQGLVPALLDAGHELVLPQRAPSNSAQRPQIAPLEAMSVEDWLPLLGGCDAVVHSAAIAHIGPDRPEAEYAAVNAEAPGRLAEAAARAGCKRFIFISSIRAQTGPFSPDVQTEASPELPTEAYGHSKLAGEKLVRAAFPAATIFRPPLIVGLQPKANLKALVRIASLPIPLPFVGFRQPQAMVSVSSVVAAIHLALTAPQMTGETFVLADAPAPSLANMISWIREGQGRSANLFSAPQSLLSVAFRLLGQSDRFDRLVRKMDVDASKLRARGWVQSQTTADTFRALGRAEKNLKQP